MLLGGGIYSINIECRLTLASRSGGMHPLAGRAPSCPALGQALPLAGARAPMRSHNRDAGLKAGNSARRRAGRPCGGAEAGIGNAAAGPGAAAGKEGRSRSQGFRGLSGSGVVWSFCSRWLLGDYFQRPDVGHTLTPCPKVLREHGYPRQRAQPCWW